jgi:acyl carrier protein
MNNDSISSSKPVNSLGYINVNAKFAVVEEIPVSLSRGIEILIKKAAVDEDFKLRLLENRAEAAGSIGLQLQPAEAMMLAAVPASQLESIIGHTSIPQEHRRAFLGQVAAVMLATLGVVSSGCDRPPSRGVRPDPPAAGGCRPGPELKSDEVPLPPTDASPASQAAKISEIEKRVNAIVAKQLGIEPGNLSRSTSFVNDLHADSLDCVELVMEFEEQFNINIPDDAAVKISTLGEAIDFIVKAESRK